MVQSDDAKATENTDTVTAKKIFIVCPIGADDSPERTRSDKLLKFVIYPVVRGLLGVEPESVTVRSDKIGEPGKITTQIVRELADSDVVVADLTGTNPNVMYEVGVRQALIRPLVLMAEKGQKLPFDLVDFRTIFYTLDLDHFESAQAELKSHLEKALAGVVAPLNHAIFSSSRNEAPVQAPNGNRDLLAVLEVSENILQETQEVKELVRAVGQIAVQIRGSKEDEEKKHKEVMAQQMGMMLMSQFLQNPESAEKLMPIIQKFTDHNETPSTGKPKKRSK